MLKTISSSQLRPGMYLHKLCGNWINHPFWRSSFVLSDPKDIAIIMRSDVNEVIIDTAKGLDVETPKETSPSTNKNQVSTQSSTNETPKVRNTPSRRADWQRAKAICESSKEAVELMFQDVRMGKVVDTQAIGLLVDDIASTTLTSRNSVINMARLKTCDNYTYMHSVAVCAMMITLAQKLGLSDTEVNQAGTGGLMHDMGKAMMPPEVLNKPGKLTDDEYNIMKTHPREGYKLLHNGDHVDPEVLDIVLHHHEKYDGSGYPDGLKGEEISLLSRMAAVCDVYDAVTSTRPYKDGWDPAHSLKQMVSWKGHFDPAVLQAFIKCIGIYPVGSLVKLESDRLGIVIEQTENKLLTPKVKVFFSARSKSPISITEIDLSSARCRDQIVSVEDSVKWGFKKLDELWIPD